MTRPATIPVEERSPFLRHYYRNRERISERIAKRAKERRHALMQKLYDYLREHPCVDCPEADPIVLDFDHVRGEKTASVSVLVATLKSWEIILAEIEKCEVRCSNCHRRRTAREKGFLWYLNEMEITTANAETPGTQP